MSMFIMIDIIDTWGQIVQRKNPKNWRGGACLGPAPVGCAKDSPRREEDARD
jgi:hypothetical protein